MSGKAPHEVGETGWTWPMCPAVGYLDRGQNRTERHQSRPRDRQVTAKPIAGNPPDSTEAPGTFMRSTRCTDWSMIKRYQREPTRRRRSGKRRQPYQTTRLSLSFVFLLSLFGGFRFSHQTRERQADGRWEQLPLRHTLYPGKRRRVVYTTTYRQPFGRQVVPSQRQRPCHVLHLSGPPDNPPPEVHHPLRKNLVCGDLNSSGQKEGGLGGQNVGSL